VPREQRRGYNIAAILAGPDGIPVHWARNAITADQNATRHAEVRVITEYLEASRNFDLKGFSIYSTLEPCAMCAGMMVMTSVSRVVFGQSDVDFGGALGRLAIDSLSIGGYRPYPRTVPAQPAIVDARARLDEAYIRFRATSKEKMLAKFLTTPEAKAEFRKATDRLESFEAKHAENSRVLAASLEMLETMNRVSSLPSPASAPENCRR
jgi:tRNA(Arg) A34 adenosine deaminase TadA